MKLRFLWFQSHILEEGKRAGTMIDQLLCNRTIWGRISGGDRGIFSIHDEFFLSYAFKFKAVHDFIDKIINYSEKWFKNSLNQIPIDTSKTFMPNHLLDINLKQICCFAVSVDVSIVATVEQYIFNNCMFWQWPSLLFKLCRPLFKWKPQFKKCLSSGQISLESTKV